MPTPKKFTLPDISLDGLTPRELELVAFVEEMIEMTNRLHEDVQRLEREVARLKKARKRS